MATSEKYVVKPKDTLIKISKQYEIKDWKKLWNHKENRSLYKKYDGDETAISPKDVLMIPAELSPKVGGVTAEVGGKTYTFKNEQERDAFLKTVRTIDIKGKKHTFVGPEWDKFEKDMCAELRRTAVRAANTRASAAESIWDHFHALNDEQYVVSWFVSMRGPKLPNRSIVNAALLAARNLEAAVNSRDFKKIPRELAIAEKSVNNALNTMQEYRDKVIGRGEAWVTGLEVTKTSCFAIVGAMAAPMIGGGAVVSAAVASGGTALVQSTANELGHTLAGTSDGVLSALKNIARDTITDASVGAFLKSKHGKDFLKTTGKYLQKQVGGQWLPKISNKTIQRYLPALLNNAGQGAVKGAITQGAGIITGKTKVEDFAAEVAKSAALGTFLIRLDKVIDRRLANSVMNRLPRDAVDKLFKGIKESDREKVMAGLLKANASNNAKGALEAVLDAATGNEEPEEIADKTAEQLVKDPELLEKIQAAAKAQQ